MSLKTYEMSRHFVNVSSWIHWELAARGENTCDYSLRIRKEIRAVAADTFVNLFRNSGIVAAGCDISRKLANQEAELAVRKTYPELVGPGKASPQ